MLENDLESIHRSEVTGDAISAENLKTVATTLAPAVSKKINQPQVVSDAISGVVVEEVGLRGWFCIISLLNNANHSLCGRQTIK